MRIFYGLFILIFCASAAISGPVFVQDSVTVLRDRDVAFGGFSGLHVTSNGAQFVAISDRGSLQIGDFHRENGRITDIILGELLPILDTKGQPLDRRNTDAEGLAVDANGQLYISFESNNRVMRHETPTSAAVFLPKHPDFQSLQNNSGLEALAIDANNVIYAIPERSGALDRPFPVYRFRNNVWDRLLEVPRRPPFLVVGADVFDGKLYVLERHLGGLSGFSTRIRRFSLEDTLTNEEVLLLTRAGDYDNLEGISVWRDDAGVIRTTLISDDNFNFFQQTQIAEFVLIAP